MQTVYLLRLHSDADGTFGLLSVPGVDRPLFTIERPWANNAPSISCIPTGRYRCGWTYSPRFRRRMYLVEGVPGRSGIRWHGGNTRADTHGCICPGRKIAYFAKPGLWGVVNSRSSLLRMERALERKAFVVVIDDLNRRASTRRGLST